MSSLLRSEQMGYYNLVMSRESAWECLNELGELNALHFIEMDPDASIINRPFSKFIKRCDETLRKIDMIKAYMERFNRTIKYCDDPKQLIRNIKWLMSSRNKAEHTYFQEVEKEVEERQDYLAKQVNNYEQLIREKNRLLEHKQVMIKSNYLLGKAQLQLEDGQEEEAQQPNLRFSLESIAGVIRKTDAERFVRMIFRASKGNVLTVMDAVEQGGPLSVVNDNLINPEKDDFEDMCVFILLFTSGSHQIIKNKIIKICDSFGAPRYEIPVEQQYKQKMTDIQNKISELNSLIKLTMDGIDQILQTMQAKRADYGNCSVIEEFKLIMLKEKSIYTTMNMLKQENNIYYGHCWCPKYQEENVIQTLQQISKNNLNIAGGQFQEIQANSKLTTPTFFRTNKFTEIFQIIVDTYGVPRYGEVNPGLFTIATFPFLFGMMFGDILHGSLLLAFGIYVCLQNESIKKSDSMIKPLLKARYLFLLMGFFATYCGFIYNDYTSMSINFFGSCYDNQRQILTKNCVYPFGVDPVWAYAVQDLQFYNSLKMKMAVIFGVIQMSCGIGMKALNAKYFKEPLDFWFDFLPQIVFMLALFGYMIGTIILKWLTDYTLKTSVAPSIINMLINMFLKMGSTDGKPLWSNASNQESFQRFLLFLIVICIPIMLIPKPYFLVQRIKNKKKYGKHGDPINEAQQGLLQEKQYVDQQFIEDIKNHKQINEYDIKADLKHDDDDHEHSPSDIYVHSIIETIEFVLGSISNTASYLRLWALSLAHSQLAKVFFSKSLQSYIESGNIIGMVLGFYIFAAVSFAVLMLMDLMECFLHALRLHWVEFQNKFYKADGKPFIPFSFQSAMNLEESL